MEKFIDGMIVILLILDAVWLFLISKDIIKFLLRKYKKNRIIKMKHKRKGIKLWKKSMKG